MATNAEASSSQHVQSSSTRRSASQNGSKRTKSPPAAGHTARAPSTAQTVGSGSRRIRTIPPSAAFDPPTPPSPPVIALQDLPAQVTSPNTTLSAGTQRRKRRLKYDSSESSASSGTSDEEPPWWTFTQRGMAKMRARTMRRSGAESEGANGISGAESGIDSSKASKPRRESRHSQQSKKGTPASSIRNGSSGDPGLLGAPPMSRTASRNSSNRSLLWRRSAGKDFQLPQISLQSPPIARSNSAPISPITAGDLPSPGLTTLVAGDEVRNSADHISLTQPIESGLLANRGPTLMAKRQMTAPTFPRFLKRHENTEVHTDTETHAAPSPRRSGKPSHRNSADDVPSGIQTPEEGTTTPTRPKAIRRHTHRLKINLADPMKQHFKDGWPHAGTWQDAYYGYYDANSNIASPPQQNGDGNENESSSRRPSAAALDPSARRPSRIRDRLTTPDQSDHSAPPTPTAIAETRERRKSRRTRRYRQALMPPTPSGLGFTPNASRRNSGDNWKEGKVGASQDGFDWGLNGKANGRANNDIEEGNELSRQVTTNTNNEKVSNGGSVKRGWWFQRKARQTRVEEVGWKRKLRRMLFLDARVTIWIRVMNLAVVIVSLALAIRIRFDLDDLQLPGLLGPSTTLIISYSSLTAVHVLTAIYREYFGRPIGLWGLRSKMLWVCLDLIFVALWSSAMSLAVNDYIATALECTSYTPWWRGSLEERYAELLQHLGLEPSDSGGFTPVEAITHSLGITLPAEITASKLAGDICEKQAGTIALSFLTLMLYTVNMVLSLFRIFETVRRTANVNKAVMV